MIAKTKQPGPKRVNAVAYVRMSTLDQEASPEQQKAEIKKLAERHHCEIIRWYDKDLGISGDATERRKDFQRMIQDAERKGDFKVILCWDQDRFGRFDSIEAGRWIYPLRQSGVRLITVAQGEISWTDFQGRLMYTISQEGKYQFLVDLSRNSVRGKISKASEGKFAGGRAPWGYDRMLLDEQGKPRLRIPAGQKAAKPKGWSTTLVLSEDAALVETIRWAFNRYAHSEVSMGAVVDELNRRKKFGPDSECWSRQQLKMMLKNPIYRGDLTWNRSRTGKYNVTMQGQVVSKAQAIADAGVPINGRSPTAPEDWIVRPDSVPAIVDRKTWDVVQKKLAKRGKSKTFPRNNHNLLSGVLKCGHCGAKMYGYCQRRKNRDPKRADYVYRRYHCPSYSSTAGHACNSLHNSVDADALEKFVIEAIRRSLLAPEIVERLRTEIRQQLKGRSKAPTGDSKRLKQQIAELGRKIERGTENLLLADHDNLGAAQAMLSKWRQERAELEQELGTLGRGAKASEQDIESMADAALGELARLSEGLGDDDPAVLREVISQLVGQVELWFSGKQHASRKWSYFARGLLILRVPSICQELSISS